MTVAELGQSWADLNQDGSELASSLTHAWLNNVVYFCWHGIHKPLGIPPYEFHRPTGAPGRWQIRTAVLKKKTCSEHLIFWWWSAVNSHRPGLEDEFPLNIGYFLGIWLIYQRVPSGIPLKAEFLTNLVNTRRRQFPTVRRVDQTPEREQQILWFMRCQWDSSGYRAHADGSLVFWSLFHSCRYSKMSSFHYFFPWFLGVSCLIWTGDEITYQNMLNSSTVFGMGEETGYRKWPTSVCKLHFRVTGVTLVQKRPSHTNWNPKVMKHQSKALAMVQERAPKSLDNPRVILSVRTIWVYWIKHTYVSHHFPLYPTYYILLCLIVSQYIPAYPHNMIGLIPPLLNV